MEVEGAGESRPAVAASAAPLFLGIGGAWRRPRAAAIASLVALPLLLLILSWGGSASPLIWFWGGGEDEALLPDNTTLTISDPFPQVDKLLGGLLSPAFDGDSCLSRHHAAAYRKPSPYVPSPPLLSRLRSYEPLHLKCGPHTTLYEKSITQLKSGHSSASMECNYVVWVVRPANGLGNRMLTLASAFLYALLTNRVLLIEQNDEFADLFCEPFPDTSWILPSDFPVRNRMTHFRQRSDESYGNMVKTGTVNASADSMPAFVYLHLEDDYQDWDKLFFCDEDQMVLGKMNWLILRSDMYFVPGLFLTPLFQDELSLLFPEQETVFHHLGRYLLHPTNTVWHLITRYYALYLASSDMKVGIQIRIFDRNPISFNDLFDQILACCHQANILPGTDTDQNYTSTNSSSKAVLVTSLYSSYYRKLKSMYNNRRMATGETISIHQPSHEVWQRTRKRSHNQKALAEMFLLSYCDVLVTSGWSTFGYVGQGLAGLKPWILQSPRDRKAPDPPCVRAASPDPCFHKPPSRDCRTKESVDTGALVPHVRHCEDVDGGLKLI